MKNKKETKELQFLQFHCVYRVAALAQRMTKLRNPGDEWTLSIDMTSSVLHQRTRTHRNQGLCVSSRLVAPLFDNSCSVRFLHVRSTALYARTR